MQIVSYRGPGMAGGVSPALTRLVAEHSGHHAWWHIDEDTIKCATASGNTVSRQQLPSAVVEGHYRYANEFLWPVMHDLAQFANYRSEDRALYERFSRILAREIAAPRPGGRQLHGKLFVQDYQLALLPKELQRFAGPKCGVFWHIPWPKSVPQEFLLPLIEIAKSLLSAEFIGFHTEEYCANFFMFVSKHVPGVHVSTRSRVVVREARMAAALNREPVLSYASRHYERSGSPNLTTQVLAAPLGLDVDHWQEIAREQTNTRLHPALINTDFVLSVDRADYTKGVVPRLKAIQHFFSDHPEKIGQLTFAQLVTRTRQGFEAYDQVWHDIKRLSKEINKKFATGDWQPIVHLKGPLSPSELSLLYRSASIMMVNPVRDGLNLTAKEFVACQSNRPGVLMLSPHAGVYEELGRWTLPADPFNPKEMSDNVLEALRIPLEERRASVNEMKIKLSKNTISSWCRRFRELLEPQPNHIALDTAAQAVR